jgi:hypothetical protein
MWSWLGAQIRGLLALSFVPDVVLPNVPRAFSAFIRGLFALSGSPSLLVRPPDDGDGPFAVLAGRCRPPHGAVALMAVGHPHGRPLSWRSRSLMEAWWWVIHMFFVLSRGVCPLSRAGALATTADAVVVAVDGSSIRCGSSTSFVMRLIVHDGPIQRSIMVIVLRRARVSGKCLPPQLSPVVTGIRVGFMGLSSIVFDGAFICGRRVGHPHRPLGRQDDESASSRPSRRRRVR